MESIIHWGIIGCGDVTEYKSGPAFKKVAGSALVAVMRRDAAKAKDYALRHAVPKYYTDAAALIADEDIDAVYIATPPDSHAEYALAAIAAGKPVYVEKPMALTYAAALQIKHAAEQNDVKLVVAHYRSAQPFFNAIKDTIDKGEIGKVEKVQMNFARPLLNEASLASPQKAWRVDPAISGGGLFHDLAPHQLGLMLYYFGSVKTASGSSANSNHLYKADDRVEGTIVFDSGVRFNGHWDFNAGYDADECVVYGSEGWLKFSVFGPQDFLIKNKDGEKLLPFDAPLHVQQPMIEKVVEYFKGNGPNPCPAEEGCEVMRLMELFTNK